MMTFGSKVNNFMPFLFGGFLKKIVLMKENSY